MEWQIFSRTNAHGLYVETDTGHAEIEEGYTDHQVLVTVQRGEGLAKKRHCGTIDEAKSWAETQLQ